MLLCCVCGAAYCLQPVFDPAAYVLRRGMKRPFDLVTNTWRQSFNCDNYFCDGDLMLASLIFCAGMCRTELHRQCRTHVRVEYALAWLMLKGS
jgi:hypothetical protein